MSMLRRKFHTQLDEIHVQDIWLHDAMYSDVLSAYNERFGEIPATIDLDFELLLWQESNPVVAPAQFIAQSGLYIPVDTTPLSAEAWEAMHGIGQEPVADERPVMLIRRAIIEDTAGYVGRTAYDSVRVWRLYGTANGEIWGAEWRHGTDWTETTWGTMQHVRGFIERTADILDVIAEWERY